MFIFCSTNLWFSCKMSIMQNPAWNLLFSSVSLSVFALAHNRPRRRLLISQPLSHSGDLGTLLIHLFCLQFFHPVRFSLKPLSFQIFPSLLSPTLISCCQRNSNTFSAARTGQMWLAQIRDLFFTLGLDSAVIARKVPSLDECSIKPSPAGI